MSGRICQAIAASGAPVRRRHFPVAGRAACTVLAAGAVTLALASQALAARYAMVVGNDAYQAPLRPLQNAAKDARDVAAELRASGFDVPDKWVVTNASRRRMDAALQDFVSRIGEGDEVVFFYSGHGVEIDAQAALVPVDLSDPTRRPLDNSLRPLNEVELAKRQVLDESLTLNRVAAEIARRNVAFSLLIVDACRDNPVVDLLRAAHAANPAKSGSAAPVPGLIADQQADTQVLLFSAGKGQQSLDRLSDRDPVRNGVFTRVLLEAMRAPGVGLRELLPRVKSEVRKLAATVRMNGMPHVQEPKSMAAFDAPNFFFRPLATSAPLPAVAVPAPLPVQVAAPTPVACSYCPEMVVIPGDSFSMGSLPNEPGRYADEGPQRRVTVGRFELGKYEVTQGQWKAVMGSNPSRFKDCGDDCPVENVSWNDAQEYIRKLNEKTGRKYRLPSEAEWEYAARAGSKAAYSWGDEVGRGNANCDGCGSRWDNKTTAPVGQFKANEFGLHDMHGNVWEWVQDVWHDSYQGAPEDGSAWVTGGDQARRMLRGGSWNYIPRILRSANRHWIAPDDRSYYTGFRIARTL